MLWPCSFNWINSRELYAIYHNPRESIFDIMIIFRITEFLSFMKGCMRGGTGSFNKRKKPHQFKTE